MKTALIIIMVLAGLVSIFALVVVIRDIVRERKNAGQAEPVAAEPAVPPRTEELSAAVAAEPAEEPDENAVVFSAGDLQKTLDEKFQELDETQQRYYVEIVQYAMGKVGAKQYKNQRYEEYKIGKTRLVRMQIKRGLVVCEFILLNADFNNFIRDNKVRVKQSPTVLRLEDDAAVGIAKNSIDIAEKAALEELEYKKQQRKERRRLARMQERAEQDS